MPPTNDDEILARSAENILSLMREATRRSPRQLDGILATESPVVIGAGAGTGKTWTLAWRFVWAIASGRARPRDILTLTFTDKAAQEMRSRIGSLLSDVCSRPDCRSPLLERALAELDEAVISTIHSFALRTLRENVLTARTGEFPGNDAGGFVPDPSGGIISQPEEEAIWDDMVHLVEEGAIAELARGIAEPLRTDALGLLRGPTERGFLYGIESPERLVAFARSLSGLLESRGLSPEDCLALASDDAVRFDVRTRSEPEWNTIRDLWLRVVLPGTRPFRKTGDELSDRLARLDSPAAGDGGSDALPRFILDLNEGPLSVDMRRGPNSLKTCLKDLLGETLATYRDSLKGAVAAARLALEGFAEEERRVRRPLLALAAICWARRRRAGEVTGRFSFDDIIRLAIPVLESPEGGPRRFSEVLVDEFQDTSPLQYRLVMAAAGARNSRVFLVGDVKQSIYRFRHADPRLFRSRAEEAARGPGRYIPLTTSFRSRSDLIGSVNDVFGKLWETEYEALEPFSADRAPERDEGTVPVFSLHVTRREPKETISAVRLRAARSLAAELLRLNAGEATVWDAEEERLRACRWGDMAVLVPTRTYYDPLEEVFSPEYGIPAAFLRHTRFFSRSETRDAIAFVRALADPGDRLSLLSFRASPFSVLEESVAKDGDGLSRFGRARAVLRVMGVSAALEILLWDTSFLRRLPPWRRSAALANLRRLLDLSREYERAFGPDARGCADYLERSARSELPFEDAASLAEDADVVRIMTIHAAKGLEFPVTAIFDLNGTQKGGSVARLRPSAALGAAFTEYPAASGTRGAHPLSGPIHKFLESDDEREESARLFYVACTRARDSLLLRATCGKEPSKDSWLSMVEAPAEETLPGPTPGLSGRTPADAIPGRDVPPPPPWGHPLIRLGATAYALIRFCPAAYRMRYRQGMDLDWEYPVEGTERDVSERGSGADAGTFAHRVLERWDFRAESLPALLDPAAPDVPAALRSVMERQAVRDGIERHMRELASSEFGRELAERAARNELHREMPFRVALGDDLLLTGAVDLWFFDGDTLRVVDYKLTKIANTPPVLYDRQLLFYGAALSRLFPGRKTDLRLYHIAEGHLGAPVAQPSPGEIEADLQDAARRGAEGPFVPPEPLPCGTCPFAGSCAEFAARKRLAPPNGLSDAFR
jgi:ATP-dependent exoDNAse (exonuclease V) beta subunit